MNIRNAKRCALALVLSTGFALPQTPQMARANKETTGLLSDLFPAPAKDTGLSPLNPANNTPVAPPPKPAQSSNNQVRTSTSKPTMKVAQVDAAYSCHIFDNKPHAALIASIEAITKEVQASPECTGSPSAKSLEENGNAIKDSLMALKVLMETQDPASVNLGQLDQTMTTALSALGNLGSIVNNNNFLNSKCGRQTMSTGRVLLSLNDLISGFAPYALFAVSMNAALTPALPFVIGGAIATAGISTIAKMIDQNTLDMTNPEHRKAVLENTCQYTLIAKKVRFMQLAQSGKIETITRELEKDVSFYNAKFASPSRELSALLKYRDSKTKANLTIEKQYSQDVKDLTSIEQQISQNNDDLMVCTLATELANWARDGKTFPSSAFNNLEAATAQSDRALKLQAISLKSLNKTSLQKIADTSAKSYGDDSALRSCAQAGRSWISGARQAITMTYKLTQQSREDLETELTASTEYNQWKAQYTRIQTQKVTISRVEKAMEELAKDTSIVDRSELAQRMVTLKSGLFGSRSAWGFGKPPVLAWMDHTKKMHDEAVSAMAVGMKTLRAGAYSLSEAGRGQAVKVSATGVVYIDPKVQYESAQAAKNLGTFNQNQLPIGSREQEIACQQLESAWLDWSAAMDHLGAISVFCNMIDPVLDVKMDKSVVLACRGDLQLNGNSLSKSMIGSAKEVLTRRGYQADATLISEKMKELECPMPPVSDMN